MAAEALESPTKIWIMAQKVMTRAKMHSWRDAGKEYTTHTVGHQTSQVGRSAGNHQFDRSWCEENIRRSLTVRVKAKQFKELLMKRRDS